VHVLGELVFLFFREGIVFDPHVSSLAMELATLELANVVNGHTLPVVLCKEFAWRTEQLSQESLGAGDRWGGGTFSSRQFLFIHHASISGREWGIS